MTVNSTSWPKFPIADRDLSFDADDAIARLIQWAAGDVNKFNTAFLWRNPEAPANNRNSYRLPVVDIVNGKAQLIPHAVFSAATILSGAHGALHGVVSDEERLKLKGVVTKIYEVLQKIYGDPRVIPPWLRGGNEEEQVTAAMDNINASGWDTMPVANDDEVEWSIDKARRALWERADGDIREYRKGFLHWDRGAPEQKNSYKLPLATVRDGQIVLVPRAVRTMAQILASSRGGVDVPDDDMDAVAAALETIKQRLDAQGGEAQHDSVAHEVVTSSIAPTAPPRHWFEDPRLDGPTPIAVTSDGRVMGHLAAWGTCHAGIGNKCVMAPRTAMAYKYFLNGYVLAADGTTVRVGKITAGTGHADLRLGYVPTSDHYDNTGKQLAVVASGEDRWGIWVAGAMVPEATEADVALLRRSPLSGDWRRVPQGSLELVAALAVSTPGFPIVSMTASGEVESLCAAGVIAEDGTIIGMDPDGLNDSERTLLNRLKEQETYAAAAARNRALRRYNNLVVNAREEK